ncbi:MAG: SUMF1/EgtB/PvdO family nonheme iron enzyme [Candidatus Promineifilaceae bacterium]
MATLPPDLFLAVANFLTPHLRTNDDRDVLLLPILNSWPERDQLDLQGAAKALAHRLTDQLPSERLQLLLKLAADGRGVDYAATVDDLCIRVDRAAGILTTPHAENIFHAYHEARATELKGPQYQLDTRFVKLTLLIDKGLEEPLRFVPDTQKRSAYDDLATLLDDIDERAAVLLGGPGSGKSTLLRHLQLQHAWRELENPSGAFAFFVPLNAYRAAEDGTLAAPLTWLAAQWQQHTRRLELPPFETLFEQGRVLLLLDGLNEMPHRDQADYRARIGRWQHFLQATQNFNNTVVFSCRSLDYSASLGSLTVPVKQVQVEPLSPSQIEAFLQAYLPETGAQVWRQIQDNGKLTDLFTSPFYARLLVDQVAADGSIPNGAAAMITSSVRRALHREVLRSDNRLFQPNSLLTQRDYEQTFQQRWGKHPYALPERGILIPKLAQLAFDMQDSKHVREGGQVRVDEEVVLRLFSHVRAESLLAAGVQLNILNHDPDNEEVTFHHQLVQEYFAARVLAQQPDPSRVQTAWRVADVTPSLVETVAGLDKGTPLPALPATGWEETTLLAAAMAADADTFVRALMAVNLPLAGRCAAAADVNVSPDLVAAVQSALVARTGDVEADLRARIAAAEALGSLGDPRWTRHTGPHGDYLLPPFVEIAGGDYIIGDDASQYDDEKPAHSVTIAPFEMAIYPVTNAEYALFMTADGYMDEQWWQTASARDWLKGESSSEGQLAWYKDLRKKLENWSDEALKGHSLFTPEQADDYIWLRDASDDELAKQVGKWYPQGEKHTQPKYWNDSRFNSPNQPVVGITWYEAQAYCAWLSARCGRSMRLPSEAEWEAAASGAERRRFAFSRDYRIDHANTFESHIRQTTPVGIYPTGATPDGIYDLSGNVWEWTSSQYRDYPYDASDGREQQNDADARRTLRGGSWSGNAFYVRAAYHNDNHPLNCDNYVGFRVCASSPISRSLNTVS